MDISQRIGGYKNIKTMVMVVEAGVLENNDRNRVRLNVKIFSAPTACLLRFINCFLS